MSFLFQRHDCSTPLFVKIHHGTITPNPTIIPLFATMEPFERDLDSFLDDVVSLCKKHEIRIADLNSLAKQANSIRGSFAFAKKLVDEISSEGTASLAKLRSLEAALKEEQESHEADVRALKETIEKQKEENVRWAKQDEEKEMKCKNLEESIVRLTEELKNAGESETMIKEELQKAYLTCTSYEEQILRLNQQMSLETMDLQSRCDFFERKVEELTSQVSTMEEGMYDPEAYYCLERDRVGDVGVLNDSTSRRRPVWRRSYRR